MPDWRKINRSCYTSFLAALPGAALGWYLDRAHLRAHPPGGEWFSGLDTTYDPILFGFLGAALTFVVAFVVSTIAQMPPDPPESPE
jgi:membrane protein YqaA with SNARE-associated domain